MLESANREATSQASAKSVEHMATPKLERFHAHNYSHNIFALSFFICCFQGVKALNGPFDTDSFHSRVFILI